MRGIVHGGRGKILGRKPHAGEKFRTLGKSPKHFLAAITVRKISAAAEAAAFTGLLLAATTTTATTAAAATSTTATAAATTTASNNHKQQNLSSGGKPISQNCCTVSEHTMLHSIAS